jgi:formylmethanofuran dehydrogenase subunit B
MSASVSGIDGDLVERAADLLAASRFPLVYGLLRSTVEAQRAAVEVAELLGGALDVAGSWAGRQSAFERVGALGASLGEIRSRADLLVFWGCDPLSGPPEGTHVYGPRPGRPQVFVSVGRSPRRAEVEPALSLEPERELSALLVLRAFIRGRRVEPDLAGALPLPALRRLADALRGASYAVIVHDGHDPEILEALSRLARDASRRTRTRLVPAISGGNAVGAANVLTWQTGFPGAVSFAEGHPTYGPREFTAEALLARPDVDGALLVGCDPETDLSPGGRASLASLSLVQVGGASAGRGLTFATASFEETPGTVFRSDGIALRKRLPTPARPTEAVVLSAIGRALSARGRQ